VSEKLTPNERQILFQAIEYLLKEQNSFPKDAVEFELMIGVKRNRLASVYMNWYSTGTGLTSWDWGDDTGHVVVRAISSLLLYTRPDYNKEEWSRYINASPEEVRYILLNLKSALESRRTARSNWIGSTAHYLLKQPTLLITLGYLYLSIYGLTYKWSVFQHFDVNFFDFARPADFLLTAFEQTEALVSAFFGIVAGFMLVGILCGEWEELTVHRRVFRVSILACGFAGWLFFPPWHSGAELAEQIRLGTTQLVQIQTSANSTCLRGSKKVAIIGLTGGFAFVYEPKQRCTAAVASGQLTSLDFVGEHKDSWWIWVKRKLKFW